MTPDLHADLALKFAALYDEARELPTVHELAHRRGAIVRAVRDAQCWPAFVAALEGMSITEFDLDQGWA